LQALSSATEATSGTNAVAAVTVRRVAGLTMARAYPAAAFRSGAAALNFFVGG
jgi:hypothetical protein